ncbi:MAG: NUDIX hydrolase [Chitinophagaceae bacterium]|nr:NUDIX hydrolase [Chitinophagaceae bacterium]
MKWKTLSSEYLFHDRWFKVRKEVCETPQGKIVYPYYVYDFPAWVGALPVTEDGKFVLIRQYRHALGEVCTEIPGGCADDTDKSLQDAIARELLEETGYAFREYRYLGKISPNPSTNSNWFHMFLATGGRKVQDPTPDGNEEIETLLVTEKELLDMIQNLQIIQAMHLSCIFYGLKALGKIDFRTS